MRGLGVADDGAVLLVGSELTAVPFAAIHLPLQFEGEWTWSGVTFGFALLVTASPFYRYLLGMHFLATGGSVLAMGVQHASWNAAGKLDGVSGEWQAVVAAVLLTVLVALAQRLLHSESGRTAPGVAEASTTERTAPQTLVAGSRARA